MEIAVIAVLIAINGFFALSEIAFVSSRREIIEAEKARGSLRAVLVLRMMDAPDRFLSSIQVGITLVGVVSGVFGGVAIADDFSSFLRSLGLPAEIAFDVALFLVVAMITYLTIVMGELVPKSIGLKTPEKVILTVIPVVNGFATVAHPLVNLLSWSTNTFLRLIGITPGGIESSDDPLRDILGIARAAAIRNKISTAQAGIIANTARLSLIQLYQMMVRRDDMKCLTTSMSLPDALVASHVHHHTRFPLVDDTTGEICGYVNFKDIVNTLRLNPSNPSLLGICRPLESFAETDTVDFALRRLISTHQHIAVARDAGGKVCGMVTMEDILETIVGSIQDEYDNLPGHLYEIAPGRYVAGGGVTLRRLSETLKLEMPGDDRSLDLWLRERLGSNLKVESTATLPHMRLIVRKVSRAHIYEVIVETQAHPG